jgi:hypothetical protein
MNVSNRREAEGSGLVPAVEVAQDPARLGSR